MTNTDDGRTAVEGSKGNGGIKTGDRRWKLKNSQLSSGIRESNRRRASPRIRSAEESQVCNGVIAATASLIHSSPNVDADPQDTLIKQIKEF